MVGCLLFAMNALNHDALQIRMELNRRTSKDSNSFYGYSMRRMIICCGHRCPKPERGSKLEIEHVQVLLGFNVNLVLASYVLK